MGAETKDTVGMTSAEIRFGIHLPLACRTVVMGDRRQGGLTGLTTMHTSQGET
jgi:hypothetical protein